MPAGFIFDLDGVLTDTNTLQFNAWRMIARQLHVPFNPNYETDFRGLPRHKCLDMLLAGMELPYGEYEQYLRQKDEAYVQQVQTLTPADMLPGVADFLACASAMGIPMGIASSSGRARDVCARLGISHYFRVIGDGTSVVNHKPAPDIFLWVASRLGIAPNEAVVFEDAPAGVRGALAGGFWVIGLGDVALVGDAHRTYPTLQGVHPQDCLPPIHPKDSR